MESPVTVLSAHPTRRRRQPVKEASNMSDSIARDHPAVKVIVGVDTHKHEHVAVAIDSRGGPPTPVARVRRLHQPPEHVERRVGADPPPTSEPGLLALSFPFPGTSNAQHQ